MYNFFRGDKNWFLHNMYVIRVVYPYLEDELFQIWTPSCDSIQLRRREILLVRRRRRCCRGRHEPLQWIKDMQLRCTVNVAENNYNFQTIE